MTPIDTLQPCCSWPWKEPLPPFCACPWPLPRLFRWQGKCWVPVLKLGGSAVHVEQPLIVFTHNRCGPWQHWCVCCTTCCRRELWTNMSLVSARTQSKVGWFIYVVAIAIWLPLSPQFWGELLRDGVYSQSWRGWTQCFMILSQQPGIEALQVCNTSGEWINAPPIPGLLSSAHVYPLVLLNSGSKNGQF